MRCGLSPLLKIREVSEDADVAAVRGLLQEYQDAPGIDFCFQGFDAELESLPGEYSAPEGRLLLAYHRGLSAACAALRPLAGADCELKRLYVRPAYRRQGVGRLLTTRLIREAKRTGYTRICLDTLPSMREAHLLYESLGFRPTDAYYQSPLRGVRFLALDL